MFDQVFKNIHLATMQDGNDKDNAGLGIINNAAIAVNDGEIVFAGKEHDLPEGTGDDTLVYDGEGRWVTPALIDCHTHLVYAGNRADEFEQRLQGKTYEEIAKAGGGIMATVRATRAADADDIYESALDRMQYLFMEGVTGFEIKSGYGLTLESEKNLLRTAAALGEGLGADVQKTFLGAHALPPEYAGRADDYIDYLCNTVMPALHNEKLIDAVDGFCETIAFSKAQIAKLFKKAKSLGLPVKLHAEQLSNQGGAALAAEYGALSADHLEYIDEDGVKAMAAADSVAVLLPGAYYYLREKTAPPVSLFRKHGVAMAVATDHNPGTSPILSLLTCANMASVFFGMTPDEALRGITINAARALGWQERRGSIEAGKSAELAFWDIDHPRDLIHTLGKNSCAAVVIGGNYLAFGGE